MRNKKIFCFIAITILVILFILTYLFKPMSMHDIYDKPNFRGIVTKVYDNEILISVDEGENEIKSSDKMIVSLDVKLKDSITNFDVGDKVHVFYDGSILETYPAKINTVYAILLNNE